MTPDLLTDSVLEWFQALDYEYMTLHMLVCYGLYYSKNFKWIVEFFSPVRRKGISRAVWLIGALLGVLEILRFMPWMDLNSVDHGQKFFSILHSYIVIQVFVEPLVKFAHKYVVMLTAHGKNETKDE